MQQTPRLQTLIQLKKESDRRNYAAKHQIATDMIRESPDDFMVDSEERDVVGITHAPTGFRFHLPKEVAFPLFRKQAGGSDLLRYLSDMNIQEKTASDQDWVGVDLDGTLAKYDGWKGPDIIGDPIPKMVDRVKRAIGSGRKVKIFTARVAGDNDGVARRAISKWCRQHLGLELPITCIKDRYCREIWDDIAKKVYKNTGSMQKRSSELEDIIYGLKNYPELRPSQERIKALRDLSGGDSEIARMLEIWESGHGVISKPERIAALEKRACGDMMQYFQQNPKKYEEWKELPKEAASYSARAVTNALVGNRKYPLSYLQGEMSEFREALKSGDADAIKEELQDVMFASQMIAYNRLGKDFRVVGANDKIREFLRRRYAAEAMFEEKGVPFRVDYLAGGTNLKKPDKIKKFFEIAGSPITDEEADDFSTRYSEWQVPEKMSQKVASELAEMAPKWKQPAHIRAALVQHLLDAGKSMGSDKEMKELVDLGLILAAYRTSQRPGDFERMRSERLKKFQQYAEAPSLAKEACGDMMEYFRDNPKKYEEWEKRQKAKKKMKQKSASLVDIILLAKEARLKIKGTPVQPKSPEQADAGNYAKAHTRMHGMDITIENLKGQYRKGTSSDGTEWKTLMKHHYGYIKRTRSGADGDHVDVFIGPDTDSEMVFVVNQTKKGGKGFDEHKCMLGFTNEKDARQGYLDNYEKGWDGLGSIAPLTISQFKTWLDKGDTSKMLTGKIQKISSDQGDTEYAYSVLHRLMPRLGSLDGYMHKNAQDLENVKELGRLSARELARALRDAIIAEQGAINQYETIADSTENRRATQVLQDIADEEKVHVGELQSLLEELDPEDEDFREQGEEEVEKEASGQSVLVRKVLKLVRG